MKTLPRLTFVGLLILLGVVPWVNSNETMRRIHGMPVVETQEVVLQWLENNGFAVSRTAPEDLSVHLIVEKNGVQLDIVLKPHSPLATRVLITPASGLAQQVASELSMFLDGYTSLPVLAQKAPIVDVPAIVQDLQKASVCLYADDNGRNFQFSGFCIDTQGIVVSTAHGLAPHHRVDIFLFNGDALQGRVVRIDSQRDLAVIQASEPLPASVPLQNGRFMLQNGDPLFAITCASKSYSGIQTGFVDGPPRRVEGFPLWQVQMHIDPGSSGSPVFDEQGRLAAVIKGRFRGTNSVGFLIPFETLLHFLEKY